MAAAARPPGRRAPATLARPFARAAPAPGGYRHPMSRTPEPEIRPATPDCAPELLLLQRRCFQEEADFYHEPDIAPLTQTLDSLLEDFRERTVLGAWAEGRMVGSVRAQCSHGVCQIGRLVVHPDHRRQGLGSALMAAIERTHPEAVSFELFTGERSERNLRLYHRLGYVPAGRQVISPRLTLVLLRKPGNPPSIGSNAAPGGSDRASAA